ncbi:MAG: hypothetical protein U0871_02740 [Gemmataceae bacterium]
MPAVAAADRPAVWPEWFHAVDVAAAVLVVVTAFLVGSFAARNSDLWLHLAGGRLLTQGKLTPGVDPFGQAADRPWANTSWLFDLVAYALYSADPAGAALVGVKAAGFAAAFTLLLFLRRAGQPLWPWVVLVALGVLAAGPYAAVRPAVVSMLFLAVTLLLLFRLDWTRPGWRNPLLVGGLFAVWANTDAWFVLGPLAVGLTLLGAVLNRFLHLEGPAGSPVLPTPPAAALARAFGVGLVACLLNPFVLAAVARSPGEALTQLVPSELGVTLPAALSTDRSELELLTLSPLNERYYKLPHRGWNLNGATAALLAVGGVVSLAVGLARLTAAHILLFVGFLALAVTHVRLIPYFAIVAVPLAAAHLNGLSARVRAGRAADPGTRILLTASGFGRMLTALAAAVLLLAAYPGWLHPSGGDPVYGRVYPSRVDWAVEPDPALRRTAELLHRWREKGAIPADLRGVATGPELANYCAWFAPGERAFVNGRYAYHRADLADLLTVRRGLIGRRTPATDAQQMIAEITQEVGDLQDLMDRLGAGYVVLTRNAGGRWVDEPVATNFYRLIDAADRWQVWHLDGRATVLGWAPAVPAATRDRLRFDPGRLAFGPDVEPVPAGRATPLPPDPQSETDWLVRQFITRPAPLPAEADDARTYAVYLLRVRSVEGERWARQAAADATTRAAAGGAVSAILPPVNRAVLTDDQDAVQSGLCTLALRAARTGVAKAPDRPDVYHALALAYSLPFCPVPDLVNPYLNIQEAQLQLITAQARFLARVPPPADCPPGLARDLVATATELAGTYERTNQIDLARDAAQRAADMVKVHRDVLRPLGVPADKADEAAKQSEQRLSDYVDRLSVLVQRGTAAAQQQPTLVGKFQQLVAARLPGKALALVKGVADLKELGENQLPVALDTVVLEIRAGRLEQAAEDLALLAEGVDKLGDRPPPDVAALVPIVRDLQSVVPRLEGDYAAAADRFRSPPQPVSPADVERAVVTPPRELAAIIVPLFASLGGGPAVSQEVVMGLLPLKAINDRDTLLATAVQQYDRGLLALCGGDNVEARRRLDQANRPQGVVDLARLSPALAERVARYQRLLRRYDPAK